MRLMRSFLVLTVVAIPSTTAAHFKLLEPASWIVESDRGDPQKAGPCGGDAKDKGTPSNVVGKAVGGSKLHLKVLETIYHPGHYRVALAVNSRNELPGDPQTAERYTDKGLYSVWGVIQSPPQIPVIADGLFPHYSRPSAPQTCTRRTSNCPTSPARSAHCRFSSSWPTTCITFQAAIPITTVPTWRSRLTRTNRLTRGGQRLGRTEGQAGRVGAKCAAERESLRSSARQTESKRDDASRGWGPTSSKNEDHMHARRMTAALASAVLALTISAAAQEKPEPSKPPAVGHDPASAALVKAKAGANNRNYKVPKTPWGEPDLQGVWSYATTTPVSKPAGAGEKTFLTDEEIAEQAERTARQQDLPPRPGETGTYNNFWWDRGQSIGRTSLIVDPPDGRYPPLTPAGQKLREEQAAYQRAHPADSYLDRSPTDRCIMYHGVPPVASGYNNTYQIFQSPGLVAILDENIHHVRMIPLDGRPHLPDTMRHWNGDSRGRWEGNTLVVETKNFNDKTRLRYGGSENTVAVERFTRVSDDLIDYQYTITDPTVYTRPFTVAIPLPRRGDRIYEYACHEANHSMIGILNGARAEERRAEEAAGSKERPR